MLAFDPLRLGDLFENGLPDPAVLSELLNLKESSVGLKAYGPQGGQVLESSADAEVVGIVDGRLSTPGPILLEVLLALRVLVADMQGSTPSVMRRLRKVPGVLRLTRRLKIRLT